MSDVVVREEHPLPAMIMHWVHLVSMAVLIFTGFYIQNPFFAGSMGLMRDLHFLFMYVLIITAVVRVYWAFFGAGSSSHGSRRRVRDYKHFGYERENRGTFWPTVQYYLFLRKRPPAGAKFNSLQKGTYMFWLLLIVLQAITGFAIFTPTQNFFQPLTYAVGGMMAMRAYHYLIMWLFIVTVALHIYLSLLHLPSAALMFFGVETVPPGETGGPGTPAPTRPTQPIGSAPATAPPPGPG